MAKCPSKYDADKQQAAAKPGDVTQKL